MLLPNSIKLPCVRGFVYAVLIVLAGTFGTMALTQTAQAQCGASAGPLGGTCSGGTGSVTITINQEGLPAINKTSSGSLEIDCCDSSAISGKASCSCELTSLAPFDLFPIGFICLDPGTEVCDLGEIDCDGGNALDIDVDADHNVGGCATQTSCESSCESFCGGLGQERASSGCEGQCSQGSCSTTTTTDCAEDSECPATETCTTDSCSNDGDCLAASANCTLDPGADGCGSCVGRAACGPLASNAGATCDADADCIGDTCDGPTHGAICTCICADNGTGAASAPGALNCSLSTAISVEAASPCDGTDVTIGVGDQCIGLTTETATVDMADVNNGTGTLGPFTTGGAASNCDNLAVGTTTGTSLGGVSAFFDSTLGDLAVQTTFSCD